MDSDDGKGVRWKEFEGVNGSQCQLIEVKLFQAWKHEAQFQVLSSPTRSRLVILPSGFHLSCLNGNLPRFGDVLVYLLCTTPGQTRKNDAQIKVFGIPSESRLVILPTGCSLNCKGSVESNMPRSGEAKVYMIVSKLSQTRMIVVLAVAPTLHLKVLGIPNEIKVGYSPIGMVRCGRFSCAETQFCIVRPCESERHSS